MNGMSTSTLVSVIVAAHDEERYVGRCIRSLLAQRFPREKFDIIVVDDGSTDRTAAILTTFGDDITVLRNDTNVGLPASLNRAITSTHSKFIVRVDADDYVNSSFLDVLYMYLADNPQFDAVSCDYLLVDDREEILQRGDASKDPIACGIMFRSADVHTLGLYDESFLAHEDLEFRHRYLSRHSIYRVPVALYRYRRHDTNMTNDTDLMSFFQARVEDKHGREEGTP